MLGNNDFIIIRDVNTSTTELSLSDLSPTGSTQNVFITNAVHRYEYENLSANLSNAVVSANTKIDRKVYVDGVSAESLCAMHIDADEFHQLVLDDKLLSNMIYVVSSDNINAYDMRIMNVVDPVDAQDAATKNYVDTYINSLDVEELTASAA